MVLTIAMTVGSQPLEAIATSGGASLSIQLFNWLQVGVEACLLWFGFNIGKENATSEYIVFIFPPKLGNLIA